MHSSSFYLSQIILSYYLALISMNYPKTEATTPPYLKYSLVSFQQYCTRNFFYQHTLLFNPQKLYSNARNRPKPTLQTQNFSFLKKEGSNQTQKNEKSTLFKNDKLKQQVVKQKRRQLLNVAPAVIHSNTLSRMRFIINQRTKSQLKQAKTKVFRCKTASFHQNSRGNSLNLKESVHSQGINNVSIRPKTASQDLSGLNKIRVYLPSRPKDNKQKNQQINPWDFYEEQAV